MKTSGKPIAAFCLSLCVALSPVQAQDRSLSNKTVETDAVTEPKVVPTTVNPATTAPNPTTVPSKTRPTPPPLSPFSDPDENFKLIANADGTVLHVVGAFRSNLATDLKAEIAARPQLKTIVLSSFGGSIVEGLAVGKVIRGKGLSTHVELMCASACTLAFLNGTKRTISSAARLGFHQSSNSLFGIAIPQEPNSPGDVAVRMEMSERGVETAFIDKALATPSDDMWLPEPNQLVEQNIVDSITPPGSVGFAKVGTWSSVAQMEGELFASPLWQKVKSVNPKAYYLSIANAWFRTVVPSGKLTPPQAARYGLIAHFLRNSSDLTDQFVERFIQSELELWTNNPEVINKNCRRFPGLSLPLAMPRNASETAKQDAILSELIVPERPDWTPSKEVRSQSEAVLMDFWAEVAARKDLDSERAPREFCNEPIIYYETLAELPSVKRVRIFRAFIVQFLTRPPVKTALPTLPS
jgi:hypothetical protein